MDFAIQVVPARQVGDDRAEVFSRPHGHLLVLADGAGGTSGGAAAAEAVLAGALTFFPNSSSDCVRFLQDLDQKLTTVGQSTAVALVLTDSEVLGASVGDSSAWLVGPLDVTDLTQHQKPKPLLGSGNAIPIGFGPLPFVGRVLIGSDGLFKYVSHDRIATLARGVPFADAAAGLVAAARLRSGALQDDIAVVVASLVALAWLFTLGVIAHNAEEASFLPAWSKTAGRWHAPVSTREFLFAVTMLSLALVVLAAAAVSAGSRSTWAYAFTGYVFAMLANVFVPHVLGSIALRRYIPGTGTALLFNLPLGGLFLQQAVAQGFVAWGIIAWVAPVTALAIVASIPVLFAIGRWLLSGKGLGVKNAT